jgi:hypothetical protein
MTGKGWLYWLIEALCAGAIVAGVTALCVSMARPLRDVAGLVARAQASGLASWRWTRKASNAADLSMADDLPADDEDYEDEWADYCVRHCVDDLCRGIRGCAYPKVGEP